MLFIKNFGHDSYFNLATEEYLLENSVEDIFMLWQNPPSVIIGVNQNTIEEVDSSYADANGIKVVRRLTGGGAVYHDFGNINYTIIQKHSNALFTNYDLFTRVVRDFLNSLGVDARLKGKNDLVIDEKKFSGNAQCVRNKRIMHHGTLMFDSDIDELTKVLTPDPLKIQSKGVKSVRSRVTNIKDHLTGELKEMTTDEFAFLFEKFCFESIDNIEAYEFNDEDISSITALMNNKYATWDWNYGHSPRYEYSFKKKYDYGLVDVRINVSSGIINDIKIYGDFFGQKDIGALEKRLIGIPHSKADIIEALSETDLDEYISGMTTDEFVKLVGF